MISIAIDGKKMLLGYIIVIMTLFGSQSVAAEFLWGPSNSSDPNSVEAVIIRGEIRKGDLNHLCKFVKRDITRFHRSLIVLASSGGDLLEAIKIGNLIKSSYQSVFVNHEVGLCSSACFFIYVAAVEHDATSHSLGIHRPYIAPEYYANLSLATAEAKKNTLLKGVQAYLKSQEVPQYLIEIMLSRTSNEVYWLTDDDINHIGRRASWYDQLLVERCGLNKRMEQGFLAEGDSFSHAKQARIHVGEVAACAYDLKINEGGVGLRKYLSLHCPK